MEYSQSHIKKLVSNVESALRTLDTANNMIESLQILIDNHKRELNYTLEMFSETRGSVGAIPKVSKIKTLSREEKAKVYASFFKKKNNKIIK